MSKIRQKISITDAEDRNIRRQWDPKRGRWYFSIADVMAVLTESVDARNYWKALKNRLKTTHPQLVTDCYQLKMRASDGKSYLVDTADADTLLNIIQLVAPYNIYVFKSWFEHIEVKNSLPTETWSTDPKHSETDRSAISTVIEPTIDMYEDGTSLIIHALFAGVEPENIVISATMRILTIEGTPTMLPHDAERNYLLREIAWGVLSKKIRLPALVDVDTVDVTESRGLVTIKLLKLNQDRARFVKVRSV